MHWNRVLPHSPRHHSTQPASPVPVPQGLPKVVANSTLKGTAGPQAPQPDVCFLKESCASSVVEGHWPALPAIVFFCLKQNKTKLNQSQAPCLTRRPGQGSSHGGRRAEAAACPTGPRVLDLNKPTGIGHRASPHHRSQDSTQQPGEVLCGPWFLGQRPLHLAQTVSVWCGQGPQSLLLLLRFLR